MKYYCENTGIEYIDPSGEPPCRFCHKTMLGESRHCRTKLKKLPAHETVAQWESRTGEKYPDTAPVYGLHKPSGEWYVRFWKDLRIGYGECAVVATEAGAPPENWHPLDCGKCSKAAEEQVCIVCDKQ